MKWRVASIQKYGAKKVERDGIHFSSKLEAAVYELLKLRQLDGEILEIKCQDHVYLSEARVLYIPDFKCKLGSGEFLYVEAKGFESQRWPTIKKLWKVYGPAKLEIYKGHYARPMLHETIIPKGPI